MALLRGHRRPGLSTSAMGFASRSLPLFAQIVVEVPSMGDSITEGTLISVEKAVGEAVEQDEVRHPSSTSPTSSTSWPRVLPSRT